MTKNRNNIGNISKINLNLILKTQDIILGVVIICACVLLLIVFMKFNNSYKKIVVINDTHTDEDYIKPNIDYNNPALYHSTKSVDGENQFNMDTQWKSQPSKCFDCEAQLEATCGDSCVYNATKQKLF